MQEITIKFEPLFSTQENQLVEKSIISLTEEEFPVSFVEKTVSYKRAPIYKEFRTFQNNLYERSNITKKHVLQTMRYHIRSKSDFEDPDTIVFFDNYLWRKKNREPVYLIKRIKNETKVGVTHISRDHPKYERHMFHSLAVQPIMRALGLPEEMSSEEAVEQYFLSFIEVEMPNEITIDPAKGYIEEQIAMEQKRIDKYEATIQRASKQLERNQTAEAAARERLEELENELKKY